MVDSLLGLGTGLFWASCPVVGQADRRLQAGSQILGEALASASSSGGRRSCARAAGPVVGRTLADVRLRWRPARRFVASVWIAPLALIWILNWARLAALLRL